VSELTTPEAAGQASRGGLGLTFSAPAWLEDTPGIVWRPLAGTAIEIRTAAAWRTDNRPPLLRSLVAVAARRGGRRARRRRTRSG